MRGFGCSDRKALPGHYQCAGPVSHPQSLRASAQKKSLRAAERDRPAVEQQRQRFRADVVTLPLKDLVFVDESGVRTNLTRLYGRAPKGEHVREAVPHGHWKVLTILGALTTKGVQASMTDTALSAV